MSKIAWDDVRIRYIADDYYSYAKLAEKYGVATSTIKRRAKKENWQSLRQEFKKKKIKSS